MVVEYGNTIALLGSRPDPVRFTTDGGRAIVVTNVHNSQGGASRCSDSMAPSPLPPP